MTKRKIGDKVKIKSDLEVGIYNDESVTESMLEFKGKEATIVEILHNNEYSLDIDDLTWYWTDEMFED